MNTRTLKKHLRYIVPQMRLALIKEPGATPQSIRCPDDIERFVEPMKFYSDFVSKLDMCPGPLACHNHPVEHALRGT